MNCNDCNKNKASKLVFDNKNKEFFYLCPDCIDHTKDYICFFKAINKAIEEDEN